MPGATRTEETTSRKNAENRANAAYQKELQELKLDRDRQLSRVHADRDAAQQDLDRTHRAAVRKIWQDFHDADLKLRDKRRKALA